MRSIIATGIVITAGALCALSLGGCDGGADVPERPADEPTRSADDVDPAFTEEEARQAEEAAQNP